MHLISETHIASNKSEVAKLKQKYQQLEQQFDSLTAEVGLSSGPKQIIDLHIKRLKEYNELRDVGLRLVQLVADEKSCRVKDVFEEMGYSMKDD